MRYLAMLFGYCKNLVEDFPMKTQKHLLLTALVVVLFLPKSWADGAAPAGVYDWQTAIELHPGILYVKHELTSPRILQLHAVRIDLKQPGLTLHTTEADPLNGQPMPDFPEGIVRTRRMTTCNYVDVCRKAGMNMILAVNAAPWSPFQAPWNHKYADNIGFTVSDGKLVAPDNGRPTFFYYQDGHAEMRKPNGDQEDIAALKVAVSGFDVIVREGKNIVQDTALHPRTCFGLSQEGRHLYLLVIDGRQKDFSLGVTTSECADWLVHLGAWDGLNMDGGGSTSLAFFNGDKPVMLNHQSNNSRRSVANNVGVHYMAVPDPQ